MYELSVEDSGKMLLFLDAMSFIPAVGPDSDMDGHDLSSLTYSEEQDRDEFIERFNENYADKAREFHFMGMPVILVEAFWDDEIMGSQNDGEDEDISEEDWPAVEKAMVDTWKQLFKLSPDKIAEYLEEYKLKRGPSAGQA